MTDLRQDEGRSFAEDSLHSAFDHERGNRLYRILVNQWTRLKKGWRLFGILLAGLASGMAFAPFYFLPGWIAGWFIVINVIRRAENRKQAMLFSWIWGLGHFLPGIYWIANSFLIDAARFGWMAPIIISALGAYLALYPAAAFIGAWHLRQRPIAFVFILAALWTLSEEARAVILTGFPWNLASYIWGFSLPMMQSASLWGAFGLSLLTILMTGLFTLALEKRWPQAMAPLAMSLVLTLGLFAFGEWRLQLPEPSPTGIFFRLVQANIPQWDKLTGRDREGQVLKHLSLSLQPAKEKLAAIIWPETAVTFFLDREEGMRRFLVQSISRNKGQTYLMTGALRGDSGGGDSGGGDSGSGDSGKSGKDVKYWNSLYVLDPAGAVAATFDKFHLVPLGEFVPFGKYLPFIRKLTKGSGNFSYGPGPSTLIVDGLPRFSPLICYEVIFPGKVVASGKRPQWLLNITNDGWFGESSGPYQHFVSARFRAIEEGLPLLRAANSGISASIDPKGRIMAETQLGETTILDANLPASLPETIFVKNRSASILLLLVFCAGLGILFTTHNRGVMS